MSSHLNEHEMHEALDAGADDVISKPPQIQELYARLRVGERLLNAQRDLIRLANTDPMTELLNRRAFFQRGAALCAKAAAQPISAILLDVDHFKEVNDLYGHETGDQTLRELASLLKPTSTIVGRLGGDELCVVVPRGLDEALDLAEDLRSSIADLSVGTPDGYVSVTCSLGVAQGYGRAGLDSIIRTADIALYWAKDQGRNCVAMAPAHLKECGARGHGVARRRSR
jgi:two-component system cell cycle response regulator